MLRFALCVLCVSAVQSAFAADHALLSEPSTVTRRVSTVNTDQQVRRSPSTPQPELIDGDLWICSVGQKPIINRQALDRAKEQGWGFWSFAAHAKCRAGIYLARATGGQLHDTGGDPWSDAPPRNDPLVSYVRAPSARPTAASMPIVRYAVARPVYYAAPSTYSAPGVSSGSAYGSACSTGDCGYSTAASAGYYGGTAGYGYGAQNWSSYEAGWSTTESGDGCVACGS